MVQAYCMREKKMVEVKDPKFVLNKRGRPVVMGKCSTHDCPTKVQKFLAKGEVPDDLQKEVEKYKASHAKKGGGSKRSRGSKRSKKSRGSKKSHGSKRSKKSRGSKRKH